MPDNNQPTSAANAAAKPATIVRSELTLNGSKLDRKTALAEAVKRVSNGQTLPKELAVFVREDKADKKALVQARSTRKQFLVKNSRALVGSLMDRGFGLSNLSAEKVAKNGQKATVTASFVRNLRASVSPDDVLAQLSQMPEQERKRAIEALMKGLTNPRGFDAPIEVKTEATSAPAIAAASNA